MKKETGSGLRAVRRHLDDAMYSMVDYRLGMEVPVGPTGFPPFERLRQAVARLDPRLATLFRLFRLGEAVERAEAEATLPPAVLEACAAAGLLVRAGDAWRTPSLLVVPVQGLLVVVGVPPSYPTAGGPADTWFDLSSYILASSLPGSLAGLRVLEVCAGSGVQALLCARRGAAAVTGLELNEAAVATARLNAELNDDGTPARPDFRRSDALSALETGERFDFVVCNTPYAPVLASDEPPATADDVGNSVLFRVLARLPDHLEPDARGVVAAWRSPGDDGSTGQTRRIAALLAEHGFAATAFLDRAPDDLENVLRILRADVAGRLGEASAEQAAAAARRALESAGAGARGFYNQVVLFQRGAPAETRLHRLRPPG